MAYEFDSVLRSPMFTFCIGEKREPFSVHSKAIANLSDALESMIGGQMREAQEKRVEFPEVTADTFARLCQFAYVGDYEAPMPAVAKAGGRGSSASDGGSVDVKTNGEGGGDDNIRGGSPPEGSQDALSEMLRQSQPPLEDEETCYDDWDVPQVKSKKKKSKKAQTGFLFEGGESKAYADDDEFLSRKASLRKSFDAILEPRERSLTIFETSENTNAAEDFTQIFLGHAGLYVFAKQYLIDDLKDLVLAKLHKTLSTFRLFEDRVSDVVKLIRYVFDSDHTDEVDDLRDLIVHYIACDVQTFTNCPEFMTLMEDGGAFVRDLWKLVTKRLLM